MDDAATFTRMIRIWVRSLGRHATAALLVLSLSTAARAADNEPPPGLLQYKNIFIKELPAEPGRRSVVRTLR